MINTKGLSLYQEQAGLNECGRSFFRSTSEAAREELARAGIERYREQAKGLLQSFQQPQASFYGLSQEEMRDDAVGE